MRSNSMFLKRQGGAVLVVSMLLLLVMTVLALTASQSTKMAERMAGNARDLDLAFQAGEAGVRAAERRIEKVIKPKGGLHVVCEKPSECDAVDRRDIEQDYAHQDQKWWDDKAYTLDTSLSNVKARPKFVVEEWTKVKDTLTEGGPMSESGTLYVVATSRAVGGTDSAVAIVETTFAVRY